MTTTWQTVLPAVVSTDWLLDWRASVWPLRTRPDPEAFRRVRVAAGRSSLGSE